MDGDLADTDAFIAYCVDNGICLTESNRENVLKAYKDFKKHDQDRNL